MKNMMSGFVLIVAVLVLGEIASSSSIPQGPYFSKHPIPCDMYLKFKQHTEEKRITRGTAYIPGSFFQAKIQIVRTVVKPYVLDDLQISTKSIIVKVVEMLEGEGLPEQFEIGYSAPRNSTPETIYYVMGGLRKGGRIFFVNGPIGAARQPKEPGLFDWLWQWFSGCDNV